MIYQSALTGDKLWFKLFALFVPLQPLHVDTQLSTASISECIDEALVSDDNGVETTQCRRHNLRGEE